MKVHPFRGAQAGKDILRDRIVADAEKSPAGKRVVRECQIALDNPANSDATSRKFVLQRFATELDLFTYELEELLRRANPARVAKALERKAKSTSVTEPTAAPKTKS
jgi:hypothetical protein